MKVFLSLGAGVQSSTLALMAACGEITPMPDAAIFANTQDEPKSVYRWLDWLENQLPFPVHRVTAGSLSAKSLKMRTSKTGLRFSATNIPVFTRGPNGELGKIPHRSCTRDFKIKPIIKRVRELVGKDEIAAWHRLNRKERQPPLATQWIGISWDEMQRMKDSRDPWLSCSWPLIERRTTRLMCLDWLNARGFPQPPRSACVYCPFHRDTEWRRLKLEEPDEFAKAVQFERDFQHAKASGDNFASTPYLHRSCKPLDTIDFRSDTDKGQMVFEEFADECDGMCGV